MSRIFSTTSLNVSLTPTAVIAEVSMKREFMPWAKASPSDVGTCRDDSCAGGKKEVEWMRWATDHVNLVANDDLDDGFGRVSVKFTVPPGKGLECFPVGNVVHWSTIGAFEPTHASERATRTYQE